MIKDKMRCNSYRNAVIQNPQDFKDKVVLDVGCGTGILSMFCVEAGAKKVYAIDASDIADHAKKIVEINGLSDKIEVIKGKMEEIVLPEKVDVIISEWMGLFLLFESMLESVILARNRWLKEDGKMYPSKARLHIAPIANEEFKDKMEFFTKPQYGINFSCLVPLVKYEFTYYCNRAQSFPSEYVCSNSQVFFESDLRTVQPQDIKVVHSNFKFTNFNKNYLNGFGTWFDVSFEGSQSTVLLTTSPFNTLTHWKQDMFLFDEPIKVKDDSIIEGKIVAKQGEWIRHYNVEITFTLDKTTTIEKKWSM
jgi:ubiquinone/menaquinone biosynthesis C-methylase UbiE